MKDYIIKLPKDKADFVDDLAKRIGSTPEKVLEIALLQLLKVFVNDNTPKSH